MLKTAGRTGLHPAQEALEWPKTRQRQGKPAHHPAKAVRGSSQRGAAPDTVWGLTAGPCGETRFRTGLRCHHREAGGAGAQEGLGEHGLFVMG